MEQRARERIRQTFLFRCTICFKASPGFPGLLPRAEQPELCNGHVTGQVGNLHGLPRFEIGEGKGLFPRHRGFFAGLELCFFTDFQDMPFTVFFLNDDDPLFSLDFRNGSLH